MDSSKLSRSQAAALRDQLIPHVDFLRRLVERMDALNFPPDDQVYLAAKRSLEHVSVMHPRAWVLAGDWKHKVDKREKQYRRTPGWARWPG